jgi:PrtD family type I secretion system ABC transporter
MNIVSDLFKNLSKNFLHCLIFSLIINLLNLALPLYSMQILDRVLGSSSIETLIWLSILIGYMLIMMNFVANIREEAFNFIVNKINDRFFNLLVSKSIQDISKNNNLKPRYLANLNNLCSSLTNSGCTMLFDSPWALIFLSLIFYINHIIGFVIFGVIIILISLSILNYSLLKKQSQELNDLRSKFYNNIDSIIRNSETILGMGMIDDINKFNQDGFSEIKNQDFKLKQKIKRISFIIKNIRSFAQIIISCCSAIFIINGTMSVGAMIAINILVGKALAPFDAFGIIFNNFIVFKKSYLELNNISIDQNNLIEFNQPSGNVEFEKVIYSTTNGAVIIKNISFKIKTGETIGIIGKSGSGKTSILRLIAGIIDPIRGRVLIDETPMSFWNESQKSRYNGYLPQNIELFNVSVKDNICRFQKICDEELIRVSKITGIYNIIMNLPFGYDTIINNNNISTGQKQRIALARAIYGKPKYLILDEPNSNLDLEGEEFLSLTIDYAKQEKITTFIVSHKPSILNKVDKIMVINNGEMVEFDNAKIVIEKFKNK